MPPRRIIIIIIIRTRKRLFAAFGERKREWEREREWVSECEWVSRNNRVARVVVNGRNATRTEFRLFPVNPTVYIRARIYVYIITIIVLVSAYKLLRCIIYNCSSSAMSTFPPPCPYIPSYYIVYGASLRTTLGGEISPRDTIGVEAGGDGGRGGEVDKREKHFAI